MKAITETISPKKAEEYLNRNTINRALRPGVVEKYTRDMGTGQWTECPVPIVFYDTGDIADGQHRLWAIVESKAAQTFLVVRDLPLRAGLNIDTGATRTLVDNARISGLDAHLSNTLIGVARAVEFGERASGSRSVSNSQVLGIVKKHRRVSEWVLQHGPTGRFLRNASVMGAIARAVYHENDLDRLARFAEVLRTGFSDGPRETSAVALRNYLIAKGTANVSLSGPLWRDTFLKAQNAIYYFMRGKSLTQIKSISEEMYPLPGSAKKKERKK